VQLLNFTPLEAIRAATELGGQMMGCSDLGLIRAGYLADLLLVDGDPSVDVTLLQDAECLIAIMKDGRFHKAPDVNVTRTARTQKQHKPDQETMV